MIIQNPLLKEIYNNMGEYKKHAKQKSPTQEYIMHNSMVYNRLTSARKKYQKSDGVW